MTELYVETSDFDGVDDLGVHPELLRSPRRPRRRPGTFLIAVGLIAVGALVAAVTAVATAVGVLAPEGLDEASGGAPLYWAAVGLAVVVTAAVVWLAVGDDGQIMLMWLTPLWMAVVHVAPAMAGNDVAGERSSASLGLAGDLGVNGLEGDLDGAAPGFTGLISIVVGQVSDPVLAWTVRLWPVFATAVVAMLVSALASRSFPRTPSSAPLAALVYVMVAWFGPVELSTASVSLMFIMAAVVLIESGPLWVEPGAMTKLPLLSRQVESTGDRPDSYSTSIFVCLLLVVFAAVAADPLAPAVMCAVLLVLAAFGRRVAGRLWLVSLVAFTAWTLLAGRPWWTRRSVGLSHGVESVIESLQGGAGDDAVREQLVAWAGVSTGVFLLVVGLTMSLPRFARLRPAVPVVPLAVVAVVSSLLTFSTAAPGDEIMAAMLPFASVVAGRMLAGGRRTVMTVVVPVVVALAVPVLLIIRYHAATVLGSGAL